MAVNGEHPVRLERIEQRIEELHDEVSGPVGDVQTDLMGRGASPRPR